jgi:hypothetical protein
MQAILASAPFDSHELLEAITELARKTTPITDQHTLRRGVSTSDRLRPGRKPICLYSQRAYDTKKATERIRQGKKSKNTIYRFHTMGLRSTLHWIPNQHLTAMPSDPDNVHMGFPSLTLLCAPSVQHSGHKQTHDLNQTAIPTLSALKLIQTQNPLTAKSSGQNPLRLLTSNSSLAHKILQRPSGLKRRGLPLLTPTHLICHPWQEVLVGVLFSLA